MCRKSQSQVIVGGTLIRHSSEEVMGIHVWVRVKVRVRVRTATCNPNPSAIAKLHVCPHSGGIARLHEVEEMIDCKSFGAWW